MFVPCSAIRFPPGQLGRQLRLDRRDREDAAAVDAAEAAARELVGDAEAAGRSGMRRRADGDAGRGTRPGCLRAARAGARRARPRAGSACRAGARPSAGSRRGGGCRAVSVLTASHSPRLADHRQPGRRAEHRPVRGSGLMPPAAGVSWTRTVVPRGTAAMRLPRGIGGLAAGRRQRGARGIRESGSRDGGRGRRRARRRPMHRWCPVLSTSASAAAARGRGGLGGTGVNGGD